MHERFSKELENLMKHHDPPISIRDLADRVGLTYEFIRKLVRGQNLPTRPILISMASILEVDFSSLEEWVKEDQCAAQFGRETAALLFDPEKKALIRGLSCLAECEKIRVLGLLKELLQGVPACYE